VKRNLRALLLIVLVAVIVAVVLGVFLPGGDDETDAPATVASVEKKAVPAKKAAPAQEPASAKTDQSVRVQEEPSVASAAPEETTAETSLPAGVVRPSFDVVRISPSGRAVIAGRAEPGAEVTVLDDGISLGSVFADERGEWVLLPEDSLEGGDRELSLVQDTADGARVASKQVVVLSVPKPREKPATDQADSTAAQGEAAEEAVIAVLVERDGDGPSRVLQGPDLAGDGIGEESEVTIRSVDYDSEGDVTLAGRTEPEATVNVYVDEEYVGSAKASEEGEWQLSPDEEVAPGQHKLRIDKVDDQGIVLARIETPISRARPEELLLGDALVVVQPGNSLWRIARRAYGGGVYYSEIYGANRAQILDPNMIFPGQILALPVLK
jgi:nucleoid-associated protein YgaU